MSRLSLLLLAVCAGLACSCLPVLVSETYFNRAELRHVRDELGQLTLRANERARAISRQIDLTFGDAGTIAVEPCSPEFLVLVRRLVFNTAYVKDIGYLQNGKVACSAVRGDMRGKGRLDLGDPDFTDRDVTVWHRSESPRDGWREALLIGRAPWVISIAPAAFVRLIDTDKYAIAAINVMSGEIIAVSDERARAAMDAGWRGQGGDDAAWLYSVSRAEGTRIGIVGRAVRPTHAYRLRRMLPVWLSAGALVGITAGMTLYMLLSRHLFSMQRRLIRAIRRRRLHVAYQPIMDVETNACVGVEALARWNDGGVMIPPDVFVEAAEAAGVIGELTRLVLDAVLRDLGDLLRADPGFGCSINISSVDLSFDGFLVYLREAVAYSGIEAGQLRVEILERGLLDFSSARHVISAFRGAGHAVYLDDFGTGYSSLAYLQDLELDVLKIAKPFVDAIGKDAPTSLVVAHIIAMGRSLGLELIAEGVETREQADYLAARGVRLMQGWLFSKALPVEQLRALLQRQRTIERIAA